MVIGRGHLEGHDEQRDREAEDRVAEAFETRHLARGGREGEWHVGAVVENRPDSNVT
jgi:hypothetical protein